MSKLISQREADRRRSVSLFVRALQDYASGTVPMEVAYRRYLLWIDGDQSTATFDQFRHWIDIGPVSWRDVVR